MKKTIYASLTAVIIMCFSVIVVAQDQDPKKGKEEKVKEEKVKKEKKAKDEKVKVEKDEKGKEFGQQTASEAMSKKKSQIKGEEEKRQLNSQKTPAIVGVF